MGVALAACSATAPSPPALEVVLVQQRGDIAVDRVQLRVTNTSGSPTTLTAASFSSPALDAPADWGATRAVTLDPGRTVDLPVFLPAIRCSEAVSAPEATITSDAGTTTVPLDDTLDVLAHASATACDEDELTSVVRVSAAGASAGADGSITLRLAIEPVQAGGGVAELVALRGTVLLRFAAGSEAPLDATVSAGDPPSSIDVAVVPQRCDAHAIAEDKVGTLFDLVARVDGHEIMVPVARSKEVADTLLGLTAATCGLTSAR